MVSVAGLARPNFEMRITLRGLCGPLILCVKKSLRYTKNAEGRRASFEN